MAHGEVALAAFPDICRSSAKWALRSLSSHINTNYRSDSVQVSVLGSLVQIPYRIHFLLPARLYVLGDSLLAARCLLTRSTDGYARHAALRQILTSNKPWAVPFVVLLSGEYVVEIIQDMVSALPTLDREIYADFVRQNRPLLRRLRARATSYWDCYYRNDYPDRIAYPGLIFLHQLEFWAK